MIFYLIAILAAALVLYAVVIGGAGGRSKKQPRSRRSGASSSGHRGSVDSSEVRARWDTIIATSKTGASGLKSAINEADKLFDHVMKQLGYPGETMADRLKVAQSKLTNRNAVWRAHKLRNALAHELGFDLVPTQAREALADFERGLKDLGGL